MVLMINFDSHSLKKVLFLIIKADSDSSSSNVQSYFVAKKTQIESFLPKKNFFVAKVLQKFPRSGE